VVASPGVGANHGPALSSVLQQFQDLLASAGGVRQPSSGVIELTRAGTQSQAPAADHCVLPAAAEHTSMLLSNAEGSLSKDLQSAQLQTHASQSVPSTAVSATAGARSAAQNSSSDANKQTGSDSSGSSDSLNSTESSPTCSQLAKPLLASFSDALATNATSRLDAPQPAPAPGPSASPALITPPPADSSSRPAAAETLPSAPAQAAQPSLPSLHAPDTTVGRFVNDAELSSAANQSEIRIALQTDKLGAIELRAHITGDELGAAIIVEKRDAHAALAVELPALQQTLSEKQLRVDQVVLTQGSLHSTAGDAGANAQQGQRGGGSQAFRQTPMYANENVGLQQAAWFVPEAVGIFDSQGRLSVQA
jgi:flagellar hook-length control protein FliK